ncbi:MAG: sodium:proton antiporter [Bacteroidales bacterium]|nr:sodium:proton antiporter [Bacteroidales bacterium]
MEDMKPNAWVSSVPFLALIAMLFCVLINFGSDALDGASQVSLLLATGVCIALGIFVYKIEWKRFEKAIVKTMSEMAVSIFILLMIGAMSGTWMISGVVPTLIYYGIQIISPKIFLLAACVISGLVAVLTGSSWTTVATIGIALLGIGRAEGFSDGWIAGAIISGAYFGDKISPLSDTTVLASSVSGTPIFQHIRYMLYTTIPSISIALVVFLVAGMLHNSSGSADSELYLKALDGTFNISLLTLIVPVITGVLIYKKAPALVVLFVSAICAAVMAVVLQSDIVATIGGGPDASGIFKGVMTTIFGSTSIDVGNDLLNKLVGTSGMAGMLNTIWLIICALAFGAAMQESGMLRSFLVAIFSRLVKTRVGLVFSSIISGITLNMATGDQYISIIMTANMFKGEYQKQGYESRLLSRTSEDSATVTSVLIPWNTCGMTQSTVLGVPTLTYLPFCFFNLISPLMSLIHALFGWWIVRKEGDEINN